MKSATKTFPSTIIAMALACGLLILTGCGKAEKLQAYEFDNDSIPSVNSVVGERKVNGVSSGTGTDGAYQEYTYESESVTQDLYDYLLVELYESGWTPTIDFDLNQIPGTAQMATESVDSGQILLMDVSYEQSGYTIKVTKMEGTITPN